MHKASWWTLAALALVVLAGCSRPQTMILGKWDATTKAGGIRGLEFNKDGTCRYTLGGGAWFDGKYHFQGDDKLVLNLTIPIVGGSKEDTFGVSINKDDLVATDSQGGKHEYKRVK